ncbi:hypothetical protein FVE85_9138 [Porphyridium purpureum]|uniref:DUF427 domain-containing protein n=1 Tax=Porphyridium purpureum TaxID=35688 RepID=A0A5J4YNH7_PORPP|nr:hypothetical protein FVE85_9138 [Porphyridium purpureum]|eukprot:POR9488..scf222_8
MPSRLKPWSRRTSRFQATGVAQEERVARVQAMGLFDKFKTSSSAESQMATAAPVRDYVAVASYEGAELAKTDTYYEADGRVYFPADSVNHDLLHKTATTSYCGVKGGQAEYWTVRVGDKELVDAVWSYPHLKQPNYKHLETYRAFWKGVNVEKVAKT